MVTYVTSQPQNFDHCEDDVFKPCRSLTVTADDDRFGPPFSNPCEVSQMHRLMLRVGSLLVIAWAGLALVGCGHSEDEWQQSQRDIGKLKADLDAANKRHADD